MDAQPKIGVVILAAGASTRMGKPKQLLLHRGRTLLRCAADTALASMCDAVVVVIGAHAELVRREVEELPVLVVENRDWEKGMSSSIRTGLHELMMTRPTIDAVVVMLADQPLVTAAQINQLIDVNRNTGKRIVASAYGTVLGVPALFGRELFAEIAALNANEGARQVIANHPDEVAGVRFPEAAVDVDTPQDYELLFLGKSAVDCPTSGPLAHNIKQENESFSKDQQDAWRCFL
jgi:molybdenum cofactor cytidylyltransferase